MLHRQIVLLLFVLGVIGYLAFFSQYILFTCFSGLVLAVLFFDQFKDIKEKTEIEERMIALEKKIIALEIKNNNLSLTVGLRK